MRASAEAESDPDGFERQLFDEAVAKLPQNPEAVVVTDAAYVAAKWDSSSEILNKLAEVNRLAALKGFMAAQQDDEDRVSALMMVVDHYSIDELEEAGAPESAIERRRFQIAPTEEQLAAQREANERLEIWRSERAERQAKLEQERAEQQPPTLEEALARERSEVLDVNIAHNSQYFAREVKDLSPVAAEELARRLDEWWPEKPFADTITLMSPNSWRQEDSAAAWLWFGPPLDKELTPFQWAEIASCGVLFHDQTEWLKRKATEEAKQELARICTADNARVWHQALQAASDPLPGELIDAVVTNLKRATDEVYGLEYIGKRLYEAAGDEPLRSLSDVSEDFASALRPLLAKDGDQEAQLTLLGELREQLERGESPRDRTLGWLDAVDSEEALEGLFACVRLVWGGPKSLRRAGGGRAMSSHL